MISRLQVETKYAGKDEPSNYEDIVTDWTDYHLLTSFEHGDYQGDALAIYQDGARFGLLVWGYGSCTGCDSLLSAVYEFEKGDVTELFELVNSQLDGIKWFDSLDALADYVQSEDAELQWWSGLASMFGTTVREWVNAKKAQS